MLETKQPQGSGARPDFLQQAQLATYVGEKVTHLPDSNYIMRHLGTIMLANQGTITRTVKHHENVLDESGQASTTLTRGEERKVLSMAEYADYVQSVGGQDYEPIRGRAQILESYPPFAPAIKQLRAELEQVPAAEHQQFLAAGGNANIFTVEARGKPYVVRISKGSGSAARLVNDHLGGAVLSRGLPHFEQIVAASYEDGVTIAETMPGKELNQLSHEQIRAITDDQLADLAGTFLMAHQKGILLDMRPSNFFYDVVQGFGVIDFTSLKEKHDPHQIVQELPVLMGDMSGILARMGRTVPAALNPWQYAESLEYKKADAAIMERYRQIIQNTLSRDDAQLALHKIDVYLQEIQKDIAEYSNPDWVAAQCRNNNTQSANIDEVW